jgi:YHS domain-containing protein/uncharacterized membrane protein
MTTRKIPTPAIIMDMIATMVTDIRINTITRYITRLSLCAMLLIAIVTVIGGVATATVKAQTPTETPMMCPVMPDEEIDPNISVEYEGQTVYFCCKKCRRNFVASPLKYASSIVNTDAAVDHHATYMAKPDADATHEHDHSKDHGQAPSEVADQDQGTLQSDVGSSAGQFHPMTVHFPIALLVSAAFARFLMLAGFIKSADPVVRFCVWLGGASAILAATLGWFNAGWPGDVEVFGDVMFNHRWLGIATALFSLTLIVLIEIESRKPSTKITRLTTIALLAGAGLVGVTGHFGGILVFGPDYLPW